MISVIVPIYNMEKMLSRCIDSIIHQSYTDLEIILVNDGSTDNSLQLCQNYAKKDKRVKVLNKKNGGLSSARNYGIDHAQGEYISFVDSDDWIDNDFYEILSRDILLFNCDIVISYTYNINEQGEKWRPYKAKSILFEERAGLECNLGCGYPCDDVVWNKVYRKELFDEIRFPEGRIHEDTFIMAKIVSKASRIYFDDRTSYYYLQRKGSIAHTEFNIKSLDKFYAYVEIEKYISAEFPQYVNLIRKKMVNCGIWSLTNLYRIEHTAPEYSEAKVDIVKRLSDLQESYSFSFKQEKSFLLLQRYPQIFILADNMRNFLNKRKK